MDTPSPSSRFDKLALVLVVIVEGLASGGVFGMMLGPDAAAGVLAGLMAGAAYLRLHLAEAKSTVDRLALGASVLVVGAAAAGLFERVGLSADGVAHILGLILAIAAAVRWGKAPKATAALLALLFLPTLACAHLPGALAAGRCMLNDPGFDQIVSPEYAAEVKAARARLRSGEAEADDLALVDEAAEIAERLAACVPRDNAKVQEGTAP